MELFDVLGPGGRTPEIRAALAALAADDCDTVRGAVYTRREVVDAILDLVGYTPDRPLASLRLLEPSFGAGDFLLPAVERLLQSFFSHGGTPGTAASLKRAVCAVELHAATFAATHQLLVATLRSHEISAAIARDLADTWLLADDFLLAPIEGTFDFVVGNPPYVRQERIPAVLLAEYRRRFQTVFDRADLYVPFFERSLDLLAPDGSHGFICANRWLKNRYGGPLRAKISRSFELRYFIDMVGTDAFHAAVIAYPAITVIRRSVGDPRNHAVRVARRPELDAVSLRSLTTAMRSERGLIDSRVESVGRVGQGDDPWLLDDPGLLRVLRKLENRFPTVEEAGCKVGIGVATGCDRVFVGDYEALDVEPARKLRLVMAPDLTPTGIVWRGKGLVNPFEPDGTVAPLAEYPRFGVYIDRHREAIAGRHVARRSGASWYRTIDRVYADLASTPKLLIPDIKGSATVAFDSGDYYPHHNLYFVTSDTWDLKALQCVLRSSIALMFVSAYCVRMAGGFLRFQAQYLRRIRLPQWSGIDARLRRRLVDGADLASREELDPTVFEAFGLSAAEAEIVASVASVAEVGRAEDAA